MASGKLSPRQKMINLMYLVFIAMLALNMSKEVLSAFGTINESLEESNTSFNSKNNNALQALQVKASESQDQFGKVYEDAKKVNAATTKLYNYFEDIKQQMNGSVDDPKDYETMDKSSFVNEMFFINDKLKEEGEQFKANMKAYRDEVVGILGDDPQYAPFVATINSKFSANDVMPETAGKVATPQDYMKYHFEGFPLISSITKITNLQNELKVIENEIFSSKLSGQLTEMASMSNYTTLLESEVSAVYPGNKFEGSIVLGRTDPTTVPNEINLKLDGRPLVKDKDFTLDGGQVKLNVTAGNPGEHTIAGELIFLQDGKPVPVKVDKTFQVIPKPNQATVSADKMNVVYRGIDNPITVSMAGVSENNLSVSVPGHTTTKKSASSYIIKPGLGKELTVNVTGRIDGQSFPSEAKFRIKSLPRPTPTIRGQVQEGGAIKLPRKAVEISPIGAIFEDFDFDLSPVVKRFTMSVPGQASVVVNGSTLNAQAKKALNLAKTGSIIQFFDIKADIPGAQVNVKSMPALLVQLTN
jgi:gliding motility-associated protein GldM